MYCIDICIIHMKSVCGQYRYVTVDNAPLCKSLTRNYGYIYYVYNSDTSDTSLYIFCNFRNHLDCLMMRDIFTIY